MLFNHLFSPASYPDVPREYQGYSDLDTMLNPVLGEVTILPNIDVDHISGDFGHRAVRIELDASEMAYDEGAYPEGDKHFTRMFTADDSSLQTSIWKCKPVNSWTEEDTKGWIQETAASKGFSMASIPLFNFANVRGVDLMRMSKKTFCDKMQSPANYDSLSMGDCLYDELQRIVLMENHSEQDSVVPVPVMDRFSYEDDLHHSSDKHLIDLDNYYKPDTIESGGDVQSGIYCDSGYNSLADDYEPKVDDRMLFDGDNDMGLESALPVAVTKRPPGRPKGSGKKHPKRVKNVSVPEFLRDLLLSPNYCPRIIKWEDYAAGKFRFVRADEVAKLWGLKKNNQKMSFEKFSRAMRYHYKQGVLVSVPSARLVYQFGPKAPSYKTPDPNFESNVSNFNMR